MCFGGASQQEKNISDQQAKMFSTLQDNYSTQFKGQTAILKQLSDSAGSIFASGPNQFGFSPAETAALRTQADEGTAASYQKAKQAVGAQMSGIAGGNQYLPSGTEAGINANIATAAAGDQASKQLGITEAGYAQGRQNYLAASNILGGVAGQMDPLGYAGQAGSAGTSAFGSASKVHEEDMAGQQAMMGMLGGALQGGMSFLSGGLSNLDKMGTSTGGEQVGNFFKGGLGG